jgi:hypothetical protein
MYRSEETVGPVIESLLGQDLADLAVVATDDASPDGTLEVARRYAERDPRLIVEANPERLGMIGNWNRTLEIARERFPEFEYFAFASDNDLRDPEWASSLVRELEADPDAVLAYSRFGVIGSDGEKSIPVPNKWLFETRGIASRRRRFLTTLESLRAGPVMYGLHRRRTLDAVIEVQSTLLSDVLFLSHLSLYGTFVQAPETLWYRDRRQMTGAVTSVQRAALFADPPRITFRPIPVQHTYWLFQRLLVEGRRPPGFGPAAALAVPVVYLTHWGWRLLQRRRLQLLKRFLKTPVGRVAKRVRRVIAAR